MVVKKRRNRLSLARNPLAYVGSADANASATLHWFQRAPTTRDYNNWLVGAIWINNSSSLPANPDVYMLVKKEQGVATWTKFQTGTGDLVSLKAGDGNTALPLAGSITVTGIVGANIETTATIANTLSIGITGTTDHSLQLGNASGSLTSLGAATNGELPIGSSGNDPVLATLTPSGAITIVNGPGSITIGGGGTTWSVIVADLNPMVVYNGYICNKAGLLTLTLPATAAAGTTLRVTGMNTALGWSIAQNAGQQIHFGNLSTTAGVGGSISSTLTRDSIELVCVVADLEWNVISATGNLTVV
jgi:hypothetical protein